MPLDRLYLQDRAVQASDDSTFIVQLPRTGVISALGLGVRITNGATAGEEVIEDALDRIEVLANGSVPLYSVTGRVLYALNALWLRRRPPRLRTEAASAVQESWYLIPFGYYLGDREHALDLGRYASVELRVRYSPTIAATAFATGTTTFSVLAYYFDPARGGAAPSGHVRAVEVSAWTTAASGEQQVLIPNEFDLLGLLLYQREVATAFDTNIVRVRLLERIGGREFFNRRAADLASENHEELGLSAIERGIALRADAGLLNTDVNYLEDIDVSPVFDVSDANGTVFTNPRSIAGDQVNIAVNQLADAAADTHVTLSTTRRTIRWVAVGRGLPHAVYIPLSYWGVWGSAYPARQRDQLALMVEQGGAGGDARVIALQAAA